MKLGKRDDAWEIAGLIIILISKAVLSGNKVDLFRRVLLADRDNADPLLLVVVGLAFRHDAHCHSPQG